MIYFHHIPELILILSSIFEFIFTSQIGIVNFITLIYLATIRSISLLVKCINYIKVKGELNV